MIRDERTKLLNVVKNEPVPTIQKIVSIWNDGCSVSTTTKLKRVYSLVVYDDADHDCVFCFERLMAFGRFINAAIEYIIDNRENKRYAENMLLSVFDNNGVVANYKIERSIKILVAMKVLANIHEAIVREVFTYEVTPYDWDYIMSLDISNEIVISLMNNEHLKAYNDKANGYGGKNILDAANALYNKTVTLIYEMTRASETNPLARTNGLIGKQVKSYGEVLMMLERYGRADENIKGEDVNES